MRKSPNFRLRKQDVFSPNWHKQFLLAVLMCTCTINSLSAQYSGYIDSLKIVPPNPSTEDTVKMIAYTHFTHSWNGNCYVTNFSTAIIDSQITIRASHFHSMFSDSMCYSVDTFIIGKLAAGNYVLYHEITEADSTISYDSDTLYFVVENANNIFSSPFKALTIKVYPNPTQDKLIILFQESNNKYQEINFELNDIMGKKLISQNISASTQISISNLPSSIYIYKIVNNEGKVANGKFIKQ